MLPDLKYDTTVLRGFGGRGKYSLNMKNIFYYISLFVFFISCDQNKHEVGNQLIVDEKIAMNLNETDYQTFYVCEKCDYNLFKHDLKNFREHLDYKDTFYLNIYFYKNMYIATMPKDFDTGKASFLTSWLEYGFAISKSKINPNDDLFFYRDKNLSQQDFISMFNRSMKLIFKVDIITAGFDGLKNSCYSYTKMDSTALKYREIIPANFKLSDATLLEQDIVLPKLKPIEPFIDTTKNNYSVNI
jgi:hypothetical protein